MKEIIADIAIMAMSAAFLGHFFTIWRYGQVLIQEPNIIKRSLETALFLVILSFGIYKFVKDLKK